MRCASFNPAMVLLATSAAVGGCASRTHVFDGREIEPVWTAMKTVAAEPRYDDWTIPNEGNQVWTNDDQRRIEIYRKLERITHQPGKKPHVDQRTWRIQIFLTEAEPPTAKFVSRDLVVPAWAWEEAERYFADVEELLGPRPQPPVDELNGEMVELVPADVDAERPLELIEVDSPR